MKIKLCLILAAALLSGCSFYTVSHEESPVNGETHYKTRVLSMVPPGGKELSSGNADIAAQNGTDSNWRIKVGAELQTDMTGTAVLIDSMMRQLVLMSGQMALLRGVAGPIPAHVVPETGPPTPELPQPALSPLHAPIP